MKHVYLCFALSLLVLAGFGQQQPLQLQQESGKLFLQHKVAPKENWYSIGRLYNVPPNQAASFNGTAITRGLVIGESLRIPMLPANFTQDGAAGADEVLVPVYHTVKEKEGLYRISQNYNKVPLEKLRAMNNLSSDEIAVGTPLVIGYLKVKKDLSPLAASGSVAPAKKTSPPVAQAEPVKKDPPVTPKPEPVKKETAPVKTEPVQPKTEPVTTQKTDPPTPKTEPVPVPKTTPANTSGGVSSVGGGAFRSAFETQTRGGNPATEQPGLSAAFKSTSGWKDGKYYILMNKVTPGTIVRVTNPANSRVIYAKVLGEIPPMKENDGLFARISNAAAAELGLGEGRFDLQFGWTAQ